MVQVDFLEPGRRLLESVLAVAVGVCSMTHGYRHLKRPDVGSVGSVGGDGGRRALLFALSLILGVEIGFKLATRSLIFILNPCHVTTLIQVRMSLFFFRSQLHRPIFLALSRPVHSLSFKSMVLTMCVLYACMYYVRALIDIISTTKWS